MYTQALLSGPNTNYSNKFPYLAEKSTALRVLSAQFGVETFHYNTGPHRRRQNWRKKFTRCRGRLSNMVLTNYRPFELYGKVFTGWKWVNFGVKYLTLLLAQWIDMEAGKITHWAHVGAWSPYLRLILDYWFYRIMRDAWFLFYNDSMSTHWAIRRVTMFR